MSRFFVRSSSESELSEEEFSGASEEDSLLSRDLADEGQDIQPQQPARKSRFLMDSDEEMSDDLSAQRLVRSHLAKAREQMEHLCGCISSASTVDDWVSAQISYDQLIKLLTKSERYAPPCVFELLRTLDEKMGRSDVQVNVKKSAAAPVAKAFNALRQKLRKSLIRFQNLARVQSEKIEAQDSLQHLVDDAMEKQSLRSPAEEGGVKSIEITPENVKKKLQEIVSQRTRKSSDRQEGLQTLKKLFDIAANDWDRILVLVTAVSIELDSVSTSLGYIVCDSWVHCLNDLQQLLKLMGTAEDVPEVGCEEDSIISGLPSRTSVKGTVFSFVQRIDDEFTKALQNIDPHTNEYIEFLRQEHLLIAMLNAAIAYFSRASLLDFECQSRLRVLEHFYFRSGLCKRQSIHFSGPDFYQHCRFLYASAPERLKVRCLLCHVYFLALHNFFEKGRDLLIMSHVSENIMSFDIPTQILHNRAVVQLGLAAFRCGMIKESYIALQEICSTGRPKELLAQGMQSQRYIERSPEQERAERQRQLPFHMHINVELIDSAFLVCSMLLEIPQLAASSKRFFVGETKLFSSRHLRRLLDSYDRNLFNGPPENSREHIITAAKALANGNWQLSRELICRARVWDLLAPSQQEIRKTLDLKIRISGLCSFLYYFGLFYESISVSRLADQFELDLDIVKDIVLRLSRENGLPLSGENDTLAWTGPHDLDAIQENLLELADKIQVMQDRNAEMRELQQILVKPHKIETPVAS